MDSRKIIAILASLLLAAFAITSLAAGRARATTTALAHRASLMGVTSSGQIINLEKPPSWLKRNTLVHPLDHISPDTLYGNYEICDPSDQCINDWFAGGQGTLLRYWHYGETIANNMWNWWYEGTVSTSQSWPFTQGRVNSDYNNNPVYKFAFAPNGKGSGNCMSQQLFGSGDTKSQVDIVGCVCSTCQTESISNLEYFVLDGNARLVAVGATDIYVGDTGDIYTHVWLGDCGTGYTINNSDSAYLCLVSDLNHADTWGAYFHLFTCS